MVSDINLKCKLQSEVGKNGPSILGREAGNFIKKRLQHKRFLVNIVKFLRTPILKNICERLLPYSLILHCRADCCGRNWRLQRLNEIVTNSVYSFNTLNFRTFDIVLKNEMREQADERNLFFIISKINEFKYQSKYNFLCTMNDWC